MRASRYLIPVLLLATLCLPAFAATHIVKPDGTGDFPTIQVAIDAAGNGDTILLADGVFTGDGNRDIEYRGKVITVRSQSGNPEECIIDCGGTAEEFHRGFYFMSFETPDATLEGVTIRNGLVGGDD
jgi:hypothetical protein